MSCHLTYFNVSGYFNSLGYVSNMGLDLQGKKIGGVNLSESDYQSLTEAILNSDNDSKDKKLPGIINLIQLVEDMQDKYGLTHDHKHPTEEILKTMCQVSELVKYYGLESIVHKYQHQNGHAHTHTHVNRQVKTR